MCLFNYTQNNVYPSDNTTALHTQSCIAHFKWYFLQTVSFYSNLLTFVQGNFEQNLDDKLSDCVECVSSE